VLLCVFVIFMHLGGYSAEVIIYVLIQYS
jgi:hypothetical protein